MSELQNGPVVLFVDDSITERTRGVGLIKKHKSEWNVIPADSAAEGLRILESWHVDVVVSDLVMPGMDGREFLQVIGDRYPAIPVVLITSHGSDQIAAQSLELGAANYVSKQSLAEKLVPALTEILHSQQSAAFSQQVLQHVTRSRCRFSIDNDLEQIRSLIQITQDRLTGMQRCSEATVHNLTIAIRETLLNAYFHGNLEVNASPLQKTRDDYVRLGEERAQESPYAGRQIRFEMELEGDKVTFCVADDGVGFQHTAVEKLRDAPQAGYPNGNGFRRIHQQMDEVVFNEKGNQITLTKRLGVREV